MAHKLFSDLLLKAKFNDMPIHGKKARSWFKKQIKQMGKITPRDIMIDGGPSLQNRVYVGHMYFFYYDPKWKMKLPYYDRFPLIFPIHMKKDRFLGINFHYLPYPLRAKLMDALYDLVTNDKMDVRTKLNISYGILKSAAKYKYFKPCIKWYLKKHVRSRFMKVKPSEWEIALFLPVEEFESKGGGRISKQKIWRDSRKIISKW